jgi:hypothetical protein
MRQTKRQPIACATVVWFFDPRPSPTRRLRLDMPRIARDAMSPDCRNRCMAVSGGETRAAWRAALPACKFPARRTNSLFGQKNSLFSEEQGIGTSY